MQQPGRYCHKGGDGLGGDNGGKVRMQQPAGPFQEALLQDKADGLYRVCEPPPLLPCTAYEGAAAG